MAKPIRKSAEEWKERWVDDRLINAPCNSGGVDESKELIKKNRRRHGGMAFIIFNRYLCMKWKTITNSKFFIKCDILGGGG